MAGSYLGHGAKYWADRYFEQQTQTRLPDDASDLNWRDKYLALEKECSHYQATLADMRTEIEYLRTQRPVKYVPDSAARLDAEKWESAYWRLYSTLQKKESQLDALTNGNQHLESHLHSVNKEKELYRGKTAEQWAGLYFSEQQSNQQNLSKLQNKDSDIQALNTAIADYRKFSEIDGHDSIYWHHKYLSLKKSSFNRRMFLAFVVFFLSFAAGATFTRFHESECFSRISPVSHADSVAYQSEPQTGLVYSLPGQNESLAAFVVNAPEDKCYYIRLCDDHHIIFCYYVRAGEELHVRVPLGTYSLYIAYSSTASLWHNEQSLWDRSTVFCRFTKPLEFYANRNYYQGHNFDFNRLDHYSMIHIPKSDWDNLYY